MPLPAPTKSVMPPVGVRNSSKAAPPPWRNWLCRSSARASSSSVCSASRRKYLVPEGLADRARDLWRASKFSELEKLGETDPSTPGAGDCVHRQESAVPDGRSLRRLRRPGHPRIERPLPARLSARHRRHPRTAAGLLGMILGMTKPSRPSPWRRTRRRHPNWPPASPRRSSPPALGWPSPSLFSRSTTPSSCARPTSAPSSRRK